MEINQSNQSSTITEWEEKQGEQRRVVTCFKFSVPLVSWFLCWLSFSFSLLFVAVILFFTSFVLGG
jgi:hypothetical protein